MEVLQDSRPPHEEAGAAGVRAFEGAREDDRGRGDESGGTLAEDVPEVRAATGGAVRRDGLEAKIGAAQEVVTLIAILRVHELHALMRNIYGWRSDRELMMAPRH